MYRAPSASTLRNSSASRFFFSIEPDVAAIFSNASPASDSVIVREGSNLRRAFQISPDYLKDAAGELVEVNFADLGLQLARTTHALKLWLSLLGRF